MKDYYQKQLSILGSDPNIYKGSILFGGRDQTVEQNPFDFNWNDRKRRLTVSNLVVSETIQLPGVLTGVTASPNDSSNKLAKIGRAHV